MKPNSQEEYNQKTFDSFCKRLLKNEARDYYKNMQYRREHEISLSELSEEALEQFAVWDKYFEDTYLFEVMGFEVSITDEL